jgi:hypothetical protein
VTVVGGFVSVQTMRHSGPGPNLDPQSSQGATLLIRPVRTEAHAKICPTCQATRRSPARHPSFRFTRRYDPSAAETHANRSAAPASGG